MGSALLHIPEIELDKDEAKKLALAIEGVNEQYKITLDPKKAAWIDLVQVAGVIYGPRAVSYYLRTKAEKRPLNFTRAPQPQRQTGPIDLNPMNAPDLNGSTKAPAGKLPEGFDPTNIKILN